MKSSDKRAFGEMLMALLEIHGRSATPMVLDLWWRAMERYELGQVQEAMSAYLSDPEAGRYPPTPAGILAKLVTRDGRPQADEAWSIAVTARDETETVCWTEEIAEATSAAWPILDLGDRVGARMAFLAAYERLVAQARADDRPVRWSLSLGHDGPKRSAAVVRAVAAGRLTRDRVEHLLPQEEAQGPIADIARLLAGKVIEHPARADGQYRQRMAELRAALSATGTDAVEDVAVSGLSADDLAVLADLERSA